MNFCGVIKHLCDVIMPQITVNSELLHLLGSSIPTPHLLSPPSLVVYPFISSSLGFTLIICCTPIPRPATGVSTCMWYYVHEGRTTWDLHHRDLLCLFACGQVDLMTLQKFQLLISDGSPGYSLWHHTLRSCQSTHRTAGPKQARIQTPQWEDKSLCSSTRHD